MAELSPWLLDRLRCPISRDKLHRDGGDLVSPLGRRYPVVGGIPILLRPDVIPTHGYFAKTFDLVRSGIPPSRQPPHRDSIDPFVQAEIVRSCGHLYSPLLGRLPRYPIPDLHLPPARGRVLLDIGANWGRWSIRAAQLGYRVIAVDPSLEAGLAALRVAHQLKVEVTYVVADARYLPFADNSVDVAFSYSVLQHFAKDDARAALVEMSRVTCQGGTVLVQMPNLLGVRQAFNRLRQLLRRDAGLFRVRYWTPRELERTFREIIGPSELVADGFFSLNPQAADVDLLPVRYRAVVRLSDMLRRLSERAPFLRNLADSLYVRSQNERAHADGTRLPGI